MRIAWTSFISSLRTHARQQMRDHRAFEETRAADGIDADRAIDLARALAGLDARERAAAQLCFAEGYSHAEAARIMGLPLGTLKGIVARARIGLAKALEEGR